MSKRTRHHLSSSQGVPREAEKDCRREAPTGRRLIRCLPLLPAVVMTIVALFQIHLAHTEQLDPWKGGGFGMFSTTEGGPHRHVHVYLSSVAGEERIDTPDSLEDLEDRVRTLPTTSRMQQFARALSAARSHRLVRIEVWDTNFDPETLTPNVEVIRQLEARARR